MSPSLSSALELCDYGLYHGVDDLGSNEHPQCTVLCRNKKHDAMQRIDGKREDAFEVCVRYDSISDVSCLMINIIIYPRTKNIDQNI